MHKSRACLVCGQAQQALQAGFFSSVGDVKSADEVLRALISVPGILGLGLTTINAISAILRPWVLSLAYTIKQWTILRV